MRSTVRSDEVTRGHLALHEVGVHPDRVRGGAHAQLGCTEAVSGGLSVQEFLPYLIESGLD